jgi:GH25 family lysozyme M1 (1,4-beta-N-acetylmuramidase)
VILKPDPIFDVYEGESPVNWAGMNPKPILAILKASGKFYDGVRREDHQVENYAAECRSLGIPIGLYHFLLPNNITEQAQLFISVWNKLGGADIAPIIDVECDPSRWGVSNSTWASQIKVALDLVETATGKVPMIYTNLYYWGFTGSTPPSWANHYGLWMAWYPDFPDQFSAPPASVWPHGWDHWEMWQYNDKGRTNGFLANDLNIASAAFKATITHVAAQEAYIVERSLTDYDLCFTEGTGELPLDDAVSHAVARGWEAAMNGGAGFDYTDATHAIPKISGFSRIDGIPYARVMLTAGVINGSLDTSYKAPWCCLVFKDTRAALIVTVGKEGESGMTQAQVAVWLKAQGYIDAYLMDSGRSAQICEWVDE